MYYKCCKIDSHSSATNFGFDKKLKIDFPVCTIYSIRIAICISRTALYRDAVLVGDTQPYFNRGLKTGAYGHDIYMMLKNYNWQIPQSLYIQ